MGPSKTDVVKEVFNNLFIGSTLLKETFYRALALPILKGYRQIHRPNLSQV